MRSSRREELRQVKPCYTLHPLENPDVAQEAGIFPPRHFERCEGFLINVPTHRDNLQVSFQTLHAAVRLNGRHFLASLLQPLGEGTGGTSELSHLVLTRRHLLFPVEWDSQT